MLTSIGQTIEGLGTLLSYVSDVGNEIGSVGASIRSFGQDTTQNSIENALAITKIGTELQDYEKRLAELKRPQPQANSGEFVEPETKTEKTADRISNKIADLQREIDNFGLKTETPIYSVSLRTMVPAGPKSNVSNN